jgi:hypothetical protein
MSKRNTFNITINKQEYKDEDTRVGLKCNNKPITTLKVRYVNKTDQFCQKCSLELVHLDIAEEIPKGKSIR